jgi:hypothetical protein
MKIIKSFYGGSFFKKRPPWLPEALPIAVRPIINASGTLRGCSLKARNQGRKMLLLLQYVYPGKKIKKCSALLTNDFY